MGKTRILIDTDIGDDVDDALAIALALKSTELEVAGITTVYRNAEMRASSCLCSSCVPQMKRTEAMP